MYETLLRMPFLRLIIPCIAGIIISYYSNIPHLHWIIFAIGLALIAVFYISNKSFAYRHLPGIGFYCLLFIFFYILTQQALKQTEWNYPSQMYVYKVKVLNNPAQKSKNVQYPVRIISGKIEEKETLINKKAILYLPQDSLSKFLIAGDYLVIKTVFRKQYASSASLAFDYTKYLKNKGYACTGYASSKNWKKTNPPRSWIPDIQSKALVCQRYLLQKMREIIPDKKQFGIATSILLGYKNELDNDLQAAFSTTGGAHILAVSGLHVGILYTTLLLPFVPLGNSRKMKRLRQSIILPLMWIFAFITGLSPSVVRATSMLSLHGLAELTGQKSLSLNIAGASAFLMLLYNPLYLFDIGFQLSFSAVVAIITLNPLLLNLYHPNNRITRYVWSLISISCIAQAGTSPLSIYYFHQFPIVFLLTNLFVIPLAGCLIILLIIYLPFSCLITLPEIILFPLHTTLNIFVTGIEAITKIPYSNLTNLHFNVFNVAAWYAAILLFSLLFIRKKILYVYLLGLLCLFQLIYYL